MCLYMKRHDLGQNPTEPLVTSLVCKVGLFYSSVLGRIIKFWSFIFLTETYFIDKLRDVSFKMIGHWGHLDM